MTCCFAHSLPLKSVCKDMAAGSHHLQWVRIDLHKGQSHKASLLFWALRAVVQNRFGIYPLVEGPARHVHPKTTTFCLVLGFTPSGRPYRAHQSQNDLEQLYSGSFVALPDGLCGTFRSVFPSRFS